MVPTRTFRTILASLVACAAFCAAPSVSNAQCTGIPEKKPAFELEQESFVDIESMIRASNAIGKASERGFATNKDDSFRFALKRTFVSLDVRHMFNRGGRGDAQKSGVTYVENGGIGLHGTFVREQRIESGALLFGGGFRF